MIRPALFLNVFNRPHQLPPDIFAYEDQNATELLSDGQNGVSVAAVADDFDSGIFFQLSPA